MTTLHDLISATIRTKPDADPRRGRHLGELLGIPTGKGRTAVEEGRAQPHAFPLTKVSVRGSILADCAVTELEERYTNDSTQVMDVTHTIPLPPDGAVTAFEIVAGGRTVKGVCKKTEEAKADFESARKRGKTAAMLESVRDDVHTISLANVPAKSDIVVRMTIVERLRVDDGRFEFRFPTAMSPKYVPGQAVGHDGDGVEPDTDRAPDASRLTPPLKIGNGTALDLELTLAAGTTDIKTSVPLVRSAAANGALLLRVDGSATCKGDIVVRAWSRANEAAVRAYTDGERTLVVVDPPAKRKPELECPREAVFVLDRSGSMGGSRLVAAKRALRTALEGLTEKDTFEIIAFDTAFETFDAEPVAATRANLKRAAEWIDGVRAQGGTEALSALERACTGRVAPGRVRTVLFLTDGDVANDQEILALSRRFDPALRLFTVGIGLAPSAGLLSRLARLGGGTTLFVDDSQDIEGEIRRFESTFVGPMACGLGVEGARRHSGRDLFAGRAATFFVEGALQSVEVTSADGRFSGRATVAASPLALGALWARERVTELEDRLVADPSQKGIIDPEIVELGVRHQIQTRLTSFVAVDEASQVHGEPLAIVQPSERADDVPACLASPPSVAACFDRVAAPRLSMGASLDPKPRFNQSSRVKGSPKRPSAANLSKATAFAAAEVAKRDPAQPMTERLAFLVLLAALDPANAIPDDLVRDARRFIRERANADRGSGRKYLLIALAISSEAGDGASVLDRVLQLSGATSIEKI
jgi:Ca-activated chloride channel family protein